MSSTHFDINSISSTTDRLTDRAGLAPFSQYITSLGLADALAELCPHLKKNKKNKRALKLAISFKACFASLWTEQAGT
jgi:hypothetical protein